MPSSELLFQSLYLMVQTYSTSVSTSQESHIDEKVENVCSRMVEKSTKELLQITKDLSKKISMDKKSDEKTAQTIREHQKGLEKLKKAAKWTSIEQVMNLRNI